MSIVILIFAVILFELEGERLGRALGKSTLFIQQREYAQRLLLDEIKAFLIIIKVDVGPVQLLSDVLLLLVLEDMLIELLLELLGR